MRSKNIPWGACYLPIIICCSSLLTACNKSVESTEVPATNSAAASSTDRSWTNDMVWVPPGKFMMGSTNGQTDEVPLHELTIDGFWMDKTEVSNEQFEKFIKATGYVTVAERKPDPKDFPGVPEENLVA
ncbi:MAG: formylglycine-generating enzyme family protein, partial [Limisphaerales bacterium]